MKKSNKSKSNNLNQISEEHSKDSEIYNKIPQKEDIISHFNENVEEYSKFCVVFNSDCKDDKITDKFVKFLTLNLKPIGDKILNEVGILYYGFKDLPLSEKALVIGAIGYFILPADLIPDAIPVIGFIDDGVVLSYVLDKIKDMISLEARAKANELKRYIENENNTLSEQLVKDKNKLDLEITNITEEAKKIKSMKCF